MKKAITRLSFGLMVTLITLSCGGTAGYYLLTPGAETSPPEITQSEITPYAGDTLPPPLGLNTELLDSADMPYPMIGDYADLASMGGIIYSYNTSSDFHETINFYKRELPLRGYRLMKEENGNNVAQLDFSVANSALNLTITLNPDTRVVNVMIIEN